MKHVRPKLKGLLTLVAALTVITMQSAFSQTIANDAMVSNVQLVSEYSGPITADPTPANDKDIVSLFPNPVSRIMTIQSLQPMRLISIFDILGRVVKQFQPDKTQVEINIQDLQPGRYFINIRQQSTTVPIIKSFIKI